MSNPFIHAPLSKQTLKLGIELFIYAFLATFGFFGQCDVCERKKYSSLCFGDNSRRLLELGQARHYPSLTMSSEHRPWIFNKTREREFLPFCLAWLSLEFCLFIPNACLKKHVKQNVPRKKI